MKRNIFKKAHELTKKIIKKGDNYRATFRLCLSFVYSQLKKGVVKMVELTGTEKQVQWAEELREMVLAYANECLEKDNAKRDRMIAKNRPTPKTDAKIEKEINFIQRVKNESSASVLIQEFKFMTDKYADGIFKAEQLNSIIFGILG